MVTKVFICYFIIINIITCLVYGLDKGKAKRGAWRISEETLLAFAVVGGSIGAFLGMRIFHHKTKHLKFTIGVPVIILIQILLICYVIKYFI